MTTPTLRASSRADLLALPAILLGFHPTDSAVVMGLRGATVHFCARFDLGAPTPAIFDMAQQILNASLQVPDCEFMVMGFGEPEVAMETVGYLVDVLGYDVVHEALVTDGDRCWSIEDGWAVAVTLGGSELAAEAVFRGVDINRDRAQAVAPVTDHVPADAEDVDLARAHVASLGVQGALDVLGSLAESPTPLSDFDALTLALILGFEDCSAAVLARLNTRTAEALWPNLAAARRVAPDDVEADVLALLAMASWLSGRGAAQSTCLEQLSTLNPHHPVTALLNQLHRLAIPPRRWDE